MNKLSNLSTIALLITFLLVSCGGKNSNTTQEEEVPVTEVSEVTPVTNNDLQIESNDQMQFTKNELKATAGQIKLTLKHLGTMDKTVMGHNLVILKPGTDVAEFSQKAALAKDTDYIPESEKESVIAHTKIIGGGESDSIEFTITEKGTYDFICSFPGHSAVMKGKLIVE